MSLISSLSELPEAAKYDLIVAGAGGAGLAAAVFAALGGKRVLVIERTAFLGGTTALSGGTTWVPNTRHSASVGTEDSPEQVRRFLDAAVGNRSDGSLREAFIASAPRAIAALESQTEVQFRPYATHPDYEQQHEGATMRGRALEPVPFDGRSLGAALNRIRPPIPEFTIFGGMMVDRTDIGHLLNLKNNMNSFLHAAKILMNYGRDRISGQKRGSRLVMGNALIGRLVKAALARGVDIVTETEITALSHVGGRVSGVVATSKGAKRDIASALGVVLAAGGYSHHPKRRGEMLHAPLAVHSPAAPGHTGAMQDLALELGARFGEGGLDNAFWAPVSLRKRADGTTAVFPHFVMDRSKPGTVCVDQSGARFINESTSYHNFVRGMYEAHAKAPTIPCFIITDAPGLLKYGLGMVRMGTKDVSGFLADGYLTAGETIAELAGKLGMEAGRLEASIAHMNTAAQSGVDTQFGRGTTGYHRVNGDAKADLPNPTLGSIRTAPFYAVRLYPGDIGASTGLVTNPDAQVMGESGPIAGLYACGNEAQSIMGGTYPGPGITIGPALTFAYRAVQHALGQPEPRSAPGVA